MKVALTYPYTKQDFTGCNPPISILYLGASLEHAGVDVMVVDRDDGALSDDGIRRKLADYKPGLVGIPLFSTDLRQAYRLVQALDPEKHGWSILLGGPHATARPEKVLEEFATCDYVLRGEAEQTIVDLVRCLEGGGSLDSVAGLSRRVDGKIVHNPDAPSNNNLDEIAFPARHMLRSAYLRGTYWRVGHRGITDVVITSRGCPYDCNFCFKMAKKFRLRSPENIVAELASIRSQGTRSVHIMDDLFVWNKPRTLKILDLIREQKLGMEFKVRARVNLVDEDLLRAMKAVGVKSVAYGIESGSQKVLDLMNKRTTVEMNYRAIELTKKVGLQCYADAFIGFPGETPGTMKETERFVLKAKPTALNLSVMYPLPNTKVYDDARREGTLVGDWDAKGTRPWIKLPWVKDAATLNECRHKLYRRYLRDPAVVLNITRSLMFKINSKQMRMLAGHYLRWAFRK